MIRFMIGYRTSKKNGNRYIAIWLENEEGKTLKYVTFDKMICLEVALIFKISNTDLETGYCIGDSVTEF